MGKRVPLPGRTQERVVIGPTNLVETKCATDGKNYRRRLPEVIHGYRRRFREAADEVLDDDAVGRFVSRISICEISITRPVELVEIRTLECHIKGHVVRARFPNIRNRHYARRCLDSIGIRSRNLCVAIHTAREEKCYDDW